MATKAPTGNHVTRYLAGATLALGLIIGSAGLAYAEPTVEGDIAQPCAAADSTCVNPNVDRQDAMRPPKMPPVPPGPLNCLPFPCPVGPFG